ncbi:MAG: oxidoreductase, partial [Pirellulaceae bacterium]
MTELHLPWLELAVVLPLAGALFVSRLRDAQRAQWYSVVFAGLTLLATVGEWLDFATLGVFQAHDEWDLLAGLVGPLLVVDELSAP